MYDESRSVIIEEEEDNDARDDDDDNDNDDRRELDKNVKIKESFPASSLFSLFSIFSILFILPPPRPNSDSHEC